MYFVCWVYPCSNVLRTSRRSSPTSLKLTYTPAALYMCSVFPGKYILDKLISGPYERTQEAIQGVRIFQAYESFPKLLHSPSLYFITSLISLRGERSKTCGTTITAHGKVPANKAARQSLADSLNAEQAGFDAAGSSLLGTSAKNPKNPKNPKKA